MPCPVVHPQGGLSIQDDIIFIQGGMGVLPCRYIILMRFSTLAKTLVGPSMGIRNLWMDLSPSWGENILSVSSSSSSEVVEETGNAHKSSDL